MTRSSIFAVTLACLFAFIAADNAAADAQTKPTLTLAANAVLANKACALCHAEIAKEWQSSFHRASSDDPSYQRSFAREPLTFCTTCHAPVGKQPELASLGIACTTCHGVGHDAAPKGDAACASCHEFAFPDRDTKTTNPGELMQLTVSEHAVSSNAAVTCADCHMPTVGEGQMAHRSHAFVASRDPATLRRAVTVTGSILNSTTVELVLTPNETGHAFPTGDLFRQLAITVEQVDAHDEPLGFDRKIVARVFDSRERSPRQLADLRPGAPGRPETHLLFKLANTGAGRIRYRLYYQRVVTARLQNAMVEDSTLVLEGWIP